MMPNVARRRRLEPDGKRVFLDNNIWNGLVETGSFPLSIDALQNGFKRGQIEVVLTLPLLEEIIGASKLRSEKYLDMRAAAEKLGGPRVLRPLEWRLLEEAKAGGRLAESERYLPKATVRHTAGFDPQSLAAVHAGVSQIKTTTSGLDEAIKNDVLQRVQSEGIRLKDTEQRATVAAIHKMADLYSTDLTQRHGMPAIPAAELSLDRVPSMWLAAAYKVARQIRTIREGSAVQLSDHHDLLHCAATGTSPRSRPTWSPVRCRRRRTPAAT